MKSWGRCICGEQLGAGKTFGGTVSAGQRSGTAAWGGRGLEVGGVRGVGEEARRRFRGKSREDFVFPPKIQSLYLKAVLELRFVSTSRTKFTS